MTTVFQGYALMLAENRVTTERDESIWMERARGGHEDGFRYLLDRYRARSVRLASYALGRPDEAEDVAQEAFIKAFRAIRSFRGESRFSTWLYHILLRVCQDRRRLRRWDMEIALDMEIPQASPSDASDTRILVASLLEQLSPGLRAALVLREMEGLEYEEIAGILKIPTGTVRSRLNAARSRFRDLYQAAMREADDV